MSTILFFLYNEKSLEALHGIALAYFVSVWSLPKIFMVLEKAYEELWMSVRVLTLSHIWTEFQQKKEVEFHVEKITGKVEGSKQTLVARVKTYRKLGNYENPLWATCM